MRRKKPLKSHPTVTPAVLADGTPSFGPPRGATPDTMADMDSAVEELDKLVERWWSHGQKSTRIQYSLKELIRGWVSVEVMHPEWRE